MTQSHDADGHLTGSRLIMVAPKSLPLLRVVETLAAMNEQHVQHHIFDHAGREIGIDDAHDRNGWKRWIAEEVVDAGAQGEDRFQVCELGKGSMRRTPRARIGDFVSPFDLVWPDPDRSRRSERAKALRPCFGIPTAD
jgi:hypothetical protein